jgi:hypothetical protein
MAASIRNLSATGHAGIRNLGWGHCSATEVGGGSIILNYLDSNIEGMKKTKISG